MLAALVLSGCGNDTGDDTPESKPRGEVDFDLVEVISETAAGGLVSPGAVSLDDPAAVSQLVGQFEDNPMEAKLTEAFAGLKVGDDQAAYAAVVSIGCDVPKRVVVTATDTGILIEPVKSTTKPVECFAPVTAVAVVTVDRSIVS